MEPKCVQHALSPVWEMQHQLCPSLKHTTSNAPAVLGMFPYRTMQCLAGCGIRFCENLLLGKNTD